MLLLWGRFFVAKPLSQIHRSTLWPLQDANATPSLGGFGHSDEAMEIERAYQYVLADPVFRVGTRPDGPITLKTKRFIVEMYERFANKRLLE